MGLIPPGAEAVNPAEVKPMKAKKEFYAQVKAALIAAGFEYFDGDTDIKGKTRQHRRKPDYIAVKDNLMVVGEIKSPAEPPTTRSWRQKQPKDTPEFAKVRQDVLDLEQCGLVDPQVGGHGIVIRGQIPDYVSNIGKTYDLPICSPHCQIRGGYTVPFEQAANVERALSNCGKMKYQVIKNGAGPATFIFEL
jgi:hypothetical protein